MPTELVCPIPVPATTPAVAPTPARVQSRWSVPAVFRGPFGAMLALVIAVLAAYAPVLGGQFLWDDSFLVKGNLLIRSPLFCLEAFRHTLFNDESNFYRPAQTLTYIFDYWCWDLEPFGYHLTNTLIHAVNAFLLFLLLRRLLAAVVPPSPAAPPDARRRLTDRMAFGLALLWALHPVHSAAVAYISGRADSLAMGFCLAAWLAGERALASTRTAARLGWAAGAFACLLLGLCSKEIAFVWLVLFGFWRFALRPEFAPGAAHPGRRGKLAVGGGALLALGCYLYLRHLPPPPPPLPPFPVMPPKGLLMLRALGDYAGLLLFPHHLHMERQVFAAPGLGTPGSPAFYLMLAVGGVLLLIGFAAGAFLPGRGRLLRRCGAGWFLIGFLPVSNLFALNASVAEHWLYLPSIGFLLFLAGVALDLPWTRLPLPRLPLLPVAAVVFLAAGALGLRTWLRAHDWADRLSFYQQTIRDGGDVPRAREGLALAYHEVGNEEAASAVLSKLTATYPNAMAARVNLATTTVRLGKNDQARAALEEIAATLLSSHDRHGGAREFTATIRALDRVAIPDDPAWAVLRRRLLDESARFPHAWELVQIRVLDRENAHDLPGALALATQFADGHWWHAPAHVVVGRLQAALGRTEEALITWRQAARLDIYDTDALSSAALLCIDQGRIPEAVALQTNATHRQPDSLRQHLLLAQALERAGRVEEAASERNTAAQIARSENG